MFSFKIFSMMEKKDLLKKQELAEELGMKFDEASELFSEETLETMKMMNYQGGKIGINVCPSTDPVCTNTCPTLQIVCDKCIACPLGGEDPTRAPIELKWEGCPTIEPPTPPTVQQDAICWQKPPIIPIK